MTANGASWRFVCSKLVCVERVLSGLGLKNLLQNIIAVCYLFFLQKRWKNVLAGPLCVRSRDSDSESVTEWKLQHMRLWNIRNFLYWQCGKIDKKKHILTIVPLIQTCYLKNIEQRVLNLKCHRFWLQICLLHQLSLVDEKVTLFE